MPSSKASSPISIIRSISTEAKSMKEASAPGALALGDSIPLCVPHISGNEWKYIKECLDTNWVSSGGSFVDRLEESLAKYIGAGHAVATVNGTAALHIALLVAGVQPEDEVLVPTLSFIAPANTVRYVGAWPVFMDCDPIYWQLDPEKLRRFLEQECRWRNGRLVNKSTQRRVKAILPIHILGHPCDMDPIIDLAREFDLVTIEDATESLGARYKGRPAGHLGDIACFSFNGNKIITTGGGGMIVTDNREWADRARYLTTQAKDDPVEYIHNEIGFNYRLTNIQAAMGVAQMEQLESFIEKKRTIAGAYREGLCDLEGITLMEAQPEIEATYWLYTVLLQQKATVDERKGVIARLSQDGIGARPLWHPIHGLPPYAHCQAFQIEESDRIYRRGVNLPSSVGLEAVDQQKCIAAFRNIILS